MKIMVTGTRGIPDVLGGVETHCEELYAFMKEKYPETEVCVIRRSSYVENSKGLKSFKGIDLKTLKSPKTKSLEAIFHTVSAVLYAAIKRPDILHIHAIGPNLITPLARLLGLKVVMTHHGPDYERQKWSKLAKKILRIGEWAGVKFSNQVIVISEEIRNQLEKKYNKTDSILIPNGVPVPIKPDNKSYLNKIGLENKPFIFTLGRFVPEKGFDNLIRSYKRSGVSDRFKLVVAGDADHESSYSSNLKKLAKNEGVILTGFLKGEPLQQLFTNCSLFVLPSYHEGLPISLLEAMSYDCNILASNINANREVKLPEDFYFEVGNEDELSKKLSDRLQSPKRIKYNMTRYNWNNIAEETYKFYKSTLN